MSQAAGEDGCSIVDSLPSQLLKMCMLPQAMTHCHMWPETIPMADTSCKATRKCQQRHSLMAAVAYQLVVGQVLGGILGKLSADTTHVFFLVQHVRQSGKQMLKLSILQHAGCQNPERCLFGSLVLGCSCSANHQNGLQYTVHLECRCSVDLQYGLQCMSHLPCSCIDHYENGLQCA